MSKSPDAFRTISEVAEWLDTPAHVLRFWESKFTQVKPVKRAGGRRYYRPGDMQLLGGIKKLLHEDGMTIKGVQKILREKGVRDVAQLSQPLDTDLTDAVDAAPVIARKAPDAAPVAPPEATESQVDPYADVAQGNTADAAADLPEPEAVDAPAATPLPVGDEVIGNDADAFAGTDTPEPLAPQATGPQPEDAPVDLTGQEFDFDTGPEADRDGAAPAMQDDAPDLSPDSLPDEPPLPEDMTTEYDPPDLGAAPPASEPPDLSADALPDEPPSTEDVTAKDGPPDLAATPPEPADPPATAETPGELPRLAAGGPPDAADLPAEDGEPAPSMPSFLARRAGGTPPPEAPDTSASAEAAPAPEPAPAPADGPAERMRAAMAAIPPDIEDSDVKVEPGVLSALADLPPGALAHRTAEIAPFAARLSALHARLAGPPDPR